MNRILPVILFCIFTLSRNLFAAESQDELKTYLGDMNRVVIEVEEVMRNLSMKILPPKNASEQMSKAIEKFEILVAPPLFSQDHDNMLSAFKDIRDGFKLFSENEKEESVRLVRQGAALLKEVAISIRAKAEQHGLIPVRPKTGEAPKPILPSPTPSAIAGTGPTPSPHISSPAIESEFVTPGAPQSSIEINLDDIPDSALLKDKDAGVFKDTAKPAP